MKDLPLFFAALFCLSLFFIKLDSAPPYFDYDCATEGIFLNNLSFKNSYDHYFSTSESFQDKFRASYAAYRLPLTYPLSILRSLFQVPSWNVDLFLKIVGAIAFLAGSLVAARAFIPLAAASSDSYLQASFFVAALAAFPPILLAARTGIAFWGVLFACYWLVILFVIRFLETSRSRYLYAASFPAAYLAVNLWANLPSLPIALFFLIIVHRKLRATFLNPHLYGSIALAIILAAGVYLLTTASLGLTVSEYLQRSRMYVELRSGSVALTNPFDPTLVIQRFWKLINQQFLFKRDALGDQNRTDELWTLGSLHIIWLASLPLMALGAIQGFIRRDGATLSALAILSAIYLYFFTLSFPEGRYMRIVAPCYILLLLRGLQSITNGAVASHLIPTSYLAALALNTAFLLFGPYHDFMRERWSNQDGLKEIAQALAEQSHGAPAFISLPQKRAYADWLVFSMYSNFSPLWVEKEKLLEISDPVTTIYAVELDGSQNEEWLNRGFKKVREVESKIGRRKFFVFARREM